MAADLMYLHHVMESESIIKGVKKEDLACVSNMFSHFHEKQVQFEYINPTPNCHIDYLKSQYSIFSAVHERMMREGRGCFKLERELKALLRIIQYREALTRNYQ